ncbi:MAG: gliding motility-associated C-terminal domain-containing protein [Bacteroidia bacterium]|nr:gliding motility-associated C-terminal domain-containing protein [Bacteroidia bacterium]
MRYLYLLLFTSIFLFKSEAQVDTSFWFVAPDVPSALTNNPIELRLASYSQSCTIRVRQPANPAGVNLTFTLAANSVTNVVLTPSIAAVLSGPANTITAKGVYISSSDKISAYYTVGSGNNREMMSLKGRRALGVDFYTPFPNNLQTLTTGTVVGDIAFDVVATQTGVTTILITPKANCIGRAKNVTFARNLNYGETFSTRDLGTVNPTEMAGSIISADKQIAVTISGSLGNSTVCPTFYTDQITNSSELGKDYVIHRGNNTTDIAYILAPVNSTSLTVTSGTTTNWLINSGETFTVNTSAAPLSFIQADKPIYVLHTSGFGCKLGGAQVTPAYCAGSYTTAFTRISSDSMFLNIYIRSGFQNSFTLTANAVNIPVSAASFSAVPGSAGNLVGARILFSTAQIPVGAYCVLRNSKDVFGSSVHNGSTPGGSAYAYTTEFGTSSFVYANSVPTATICSNTTFTLNGQVGGGPIAGVWSTNGYGSFGSGPTTLTNNVYTPSLLDTVNKPIKIVLTSVGFCPNKSDTLKLWVLQGPIVNSGVNQTKCSNNATVQLNGSVIGASSQGSWTAVAPANGTFANSSSLSTTYFPSNTDTALSVINIVLSSINNGICLAAKDTIKVFMQKAPIVDAAPTSSIVKCSNNSTVNLSGYISNNIVTGIWSSNGTGVFVPNNISLTNNYIPSLLDITNSPVKLKLTTPPSALCKDVSDSVLVYFTSPASISAGVDLNSCKNNPSVPLNAIITGTSSSTGSWSGGTGTFVPNNSVLNPTYVATPAETTAGFVILTVVTTSNGLCASSQDQIRIDFRDKPTANFSSNTVCLNQPTQYTDLSVNTSGLGSLNSWNWNFGNGNNSSNTNPAVTYTAPGTFTTTLIVGNTFNCFDTISRPVTVFPLPNVKFEFSRSCVGSAQNICFVDSSTVIAPSTIPNTGYYWDFGGVGFSITKDTCYGFPTEGLYTITHQVTTIHGCTSSLTKTLNITPRPKARFIKIQSNGVGLETIVQFVDSSANAVAWYWDFGNGATSNNQNPSTIYTSNGTYTVTQTVYDQFGCSSTYSLIVLVLNVVEDVTELIPNIITPNNDGKNDLWRLDFIDRFYPNAQIEIFNRWGESIFKSTGYSNAWDGTYRQKEKELPVGVYFYTINLNDPNKPDIIKGTITLIR